MSKLDQQIESVLGISLKPIAALLVGGTLIAYLFLISAETVFPFIYRHGWISYSSQKQVPEMAMIEFMNSKMKLDFADSLTSYKFYPSYNLPFTLGLATTREEIYYLKTSKSSALEIKVECISEDEFLNLLPVLKR